ncbi:MAG: dihydroorotase [Lentihominibacter sp.]
MNNRIVYKKTSKYCKLPGFTDVHVHLREPGFLYKETISTGCEAARAGGYACVCTMPNLDPVPDSIENLQIQLDAISKEADRAGKERKTAVKVLPYGSITVGEKGEELSDMGAMAPHVIAFSDDGVGVADRGLMKTAMLKAKTLGKLIVAHCEDPNYPKESSKSEYMQLASDIELVRETGCSYHVCHISTKESVELVRKAKKEGLDITCETAPHYPVLNRGMMEDHGRFKMNPPIKSEEDRLALIAGIKDGTIDMIATDHAPHSREEKDVTFADSEYGIVGLETAFPVLYTKLVRPGIISLERLVEMMAYAPCRRFGIAAAETTYLWDLETEHIIEPERFCSKGRSTPFEGWKVYGRILK